MFRQPGGHWEHKDDQYTQFHHQGAHAPVVCHGHDGAIELGIEGCGITEEA